MRTFRPPNYFFAVFGEAHQATSPVDGGVYCHDANFVRGVGIAKGDVMVLYCCGTYVGYDQEVPGIGVVTDIETDGIHYQYFPLSNPVRWRIVQAAVPDFQEPAKINWSLKGNWLRKISSSSFRVATVGGQIDWP